MRGLARTVAALSLLLVAIPLATADPARFEGLTAREWARRLRWSDPGTEEEANSAPGRRQCVQNLRSSPRITLRPGMFWPEP
jgi:hypothetical protein